MPYLSFEKSPDGLFGFDAAIFVQRFLYSFGMVFPETDWVEMSPESQGVDSSKLNQALIYQDMIEEITQ